MVSTIHLKHLVNMAPRELWGEEFTRNLDVFQPEHAMFSFHYATADAPRYALAGGGTISSTEAAIMSIPRVSSAHPTTRAARYGPIDNSPPNRKPLRPATRAGLLPAITRSRSKVRYPTRSRKVLGIGT